MHRVHDIGELPINTTLATLTIYTWDQRSYLSTSQQDSSHIDSLLVVVEGPAMRAYGVMKLNSSGDWWGRQLLPIITCLGSFMWYLTIAVPVQKKPVELLDGKTLFRSQDSR